MLQNLQTLEQATFQDISVYLKSSHGNNGTEAFSFLKSLK